MIGVEYPPARAGAVAGMQGDSLQAQEDFNLAGGYFDAHFFASMEIGNRIEDAFNGNGRVRMDTCHLPVNLLEWDLREGF